MEGRVQILKNGKAGGKDGLGYCLIKSIYVNSLTYKNKRLLSCKAMVC